MDRRQFCAGMLALAVTPAAAASQGDGLERLGEPGVHAIMRHALAPGTSDPDGFRLDDCATQRNLDDRGRAQARRTGTLLRERGARFDRVLTSQWCRCRETARLLDLGPVEDAPPLNSFFGRRGRAAPQTAELRALLDATPDDRTLMLVTHQVNISAFLGWGASSGQVLIFRHGDQPEVLGRILLPAN